MPQAAKIAEDNGFGDVISYIQGKAERERAPWVWVQLVKCVTSHSKKGLHVGHAIGL